MYGEEKFKLPHEVQQKRLSELSGLEVAVPPRILILPRVWEMMMWHVHRASGEVGGLLKAERLETDDGRLLFAITEFELDGVVDQDGDPGLTYLNPVEVMKWLNRHFEGWDKPGSPRPTVVWWHSHVNFQTEFSYQDDKAIASLAAIGGFVVSVVANKKGSRGARVDFEIPLTKVHLGLKATADVFYPPELTEADREQLEKNFVERVRQDKKTHVFIGKDAEFKRLKKLVAEGGRNANAAREALLKMDRWVGRTYNYTIGRTVDEDGETYEEMRDRLLTELGRADEIGMQKGGTAQEEVRTGLPYTPPGKEPLRALQKCASCDLELISVSEKRRGVCNTCFHELDNVC